MTYTRSPLQQGANPNGEVDRRRRFVVQSVHSLIAFLLFASHFLVVGNSRAENWPMWRGPQQNGISREKGLPVRWSQTENVAWRLPLPGAAPSTPVVWDDQIFLTSSERGSEQTLLLSVDVIDGKQRWQRVIGRGGSEQSETNNLAAPSPCTDGKHVWTMTSNGTITCFDLSGNQKWQFNVEDRYEKIDMPWGMASSLVPYGSRIFVQLFHLNSRRVVALDKTTGDEVWSVVRETDARGKCLRSYATPVIFYREDRKQEEKAKEREEYLLSHGQDYMVAHDLDDGRELWRCGEFHSRSGYDEMMHLSSSPVVAENMILVPSGNGGNFQVLSGEGHRQITTDPPVRLWNDYISPMRPSPLLVDSLVYICAEAGVLRCLDAKTGKQHYRRAIHRHKHFASPVYGDGRLYFASRDGTVTVVQPGTEFKILATNRIDEPICASPVISGGRIYLRSFDTLFAFESL